MKKTFPFEMPNHKPPRVIEAIKAEIRLVHAALSGEQQLQFILVSSHVCAHDAIHISLNGHD